MKYVAFFAAWFLCAPGFLIFSCSALGALDHGGWQALLFFPWAAIGVGCCLGWSLLTDWAEKRGLA